MLCYRVLDVVVQLTILVQEMERVRAERLKAVIHDFLGRDFVLITRSNFFHSHQYLIYPGDVFLDFSNIMLKHRQLDPLSRPQPLHDSGILVPDVFFYNSLNSFNLIKSVIQPHDLAYQLGSFWHQRLMDILVHSVESVPESLIDCGDPVQLGVVRAHYCAIITDKFFTSFAEVSQRLFMK